MLFQLFLFECKNRSWHSKKKAAKWIEKNESRCISFSLLLRLKNFWEIQKISRV